MKLKNKGVLVFLVAMLLMTGVSRVAASFTVAQVEVEEPQSGKISHTVTGSGTVDNMKEQAVYAAADVMVAEVAVKQGQNVSKGDVLACLDMDSLQEKMDGLSGEIEIMRLQNMELAAAQWQERKDKSRAKTRAAKDYETAVSQSAQRIEEAKQKVKEAKEKVKEAKQQVKAQAAEEYKKKLEELQAAVQTAEKAYEDAKEQKESAVLNAKRAEEDASKNPAVDYDMTISQMEINKKQRKLEELYWQKRGCKDEEEKKKMEEQIQELEEELAVLKLQLRTQENAANKQEEDRMQALVRAKEDYSRTVKKVRQHRE